MPPARCPPPLLALLSHVPPQIIARIGWLLTALMVAFLGAIGLLYLIEKRGLDEIIADETEAHSRALDFVLSQAGAPLRLFSESYARRMAFTRPTETPRGATPDATLRAGLKTFELQAAWVLEADGRVRLHQAADGLAALAAPPLNPVQLAALKTSTTSFYMERGGVLYRVRGARLSSNPNHRNLTPGWLFGALRWDTAELSSPKLRIEGRIALLPHGEAGGPATEEYPMRVERILRGFDQQPIRVLRLEYRPSEIDVLESSNWLEALVMVAFCVIMLGVLGFCVVRWVILPLGAVRASIAQRDATALSPLLATGGYVGELAELFRQLMETQAQLERTLAERARLGRELHDGVIQTIYAAGMGLAGARATLRENPAAAERVLDDTRVELNATILDLRRFIIGLEPEGQSQRKFSEGVQAMTGLMASMPPVRFTLEIDDALAENYPAAKRMQLLQIVREAASNAVRHGRASAVTVRLVREPAGASLEICDNGTGFDPAATVDVGHGLANFQVRARELGGTISIASGAGRGTQVKLVLPEQI